MIYYSHISNYVMQKNAYNINAINSNLKKQVIPALSGT